MDSLQYLDYAEVSRRLRISTNSGLHLSTREYAGPETVTIDNALSRTYMAISSKKGLEIMDSVRPNWISASALEVVYKSLSPTGHLALRISFGSRIYLNYDSIIRFNGSNLFSRAQEVLHI